MTAGPLLGCTVSVLMVTLSPRPKKLRIRDNTGRLSTQLGSPVVLRQVCVVVVDEDELRQFPHAADRDSVVNSGCATIVPCVPLLQGQGLPLESTVWPTNSAAVKSVNEWPTLT